MDAKSVYRDYYYELPGRIFRGMLRRILDYWIKAWVIPRLQRKAQSGDPIAARNLGGWYYYWDDIAASIEFYEIAANLDDCVAMTYLGGIYSEDHKFKDVDAALYWLKKASESGSVFGKALLANFYLTRARCKQKRRVRGSFTSGSRFPTRRMGYPSVGGFLL